MWNCLHCCQACQESHKAEQIFTTFNNEGKYKHTGIQIAVLARHFQISCLCIFLARPNHKTRGFHGSTTKILEKNRNKLGFGEM